MAKTLDPNRELDRFQVRAYDSFDRYLRSVDAVRDANDRTDLSKGFAVDAAFRLGTGWEYLQHRWLVAVVSKDSRKLIKQNEKMIASAWEKLPPGTRDVFLPVADHTRRTGLKERDIEVLLDPQDRNIGFADVSAWLKSANKYAATKYIEPIQRLADDEEASSLLDLLKSMRNFIAHGSRDSASRLNRAVRPRQNGEGLAGARNAPLVRAKYGVDDLGTYLHGRVDASGTGWSRMAYIAQRVSDITATLKV